MGDLLSKPSVFFAQQLSKDPCAGYLRLAMWDKIVILPGKKHIADIASGPPSGMIFLNFGQSSIGFVDLP